jgi:hypothetical protein
MQPRLRRAYLRFCGHAALSKYPSASWHPSAHSRAAGGRPPGWSESLDDIPSATGLRQNQTRPCAMCAEGGSV